MSETSVATTGDAPARLRKVGLRVVRADGVYTDIFGPGFSEEETAVVADMAQGKARAGARKAGDLYVVRVPVDGGSSHLWRVAPERALTPKNIKDLSAESAALVAAGAGKGAKPPSDDSGRTLTAGILEQLAQAPKAGKAKRARIILEAIGKATGWSQVSAVDMRRGKARRVRLVDQFANAKAPSIRVFATALAASGEKTYSTLNDPRKNQPDPTEVDIYLEEHGVEGFALALPPGDGPALYAEGASTEADLAMARDAYAIATGAAPKRIERSLKPLVFLGLGAVAAVFLAWPTAFEVTAPGEVEPAQSEVVVAPSEARLTSLLTRVGEAVKEGAPLAEFESRELAEEEKRAAMDRMLEQLAAQEALAGDDYAKYQLAEQRSAIAAFRAEQSARRLSDLTLRAPADGRVAFITPESSVGALIPAGEPVAEIQFGDELRARLTIAASDGPLVRAGMTGDIVIRGVIDETFPITVLEDPIVIAGEEGRQNLSVLASIDAPEAGASLFKGLTGFARLKAGEASRAWIWARPIIDYLRFSAWKYLGLRL